MLAAGDTFRAAAIEQLKIWGERTGASVIARDAGRRCREPCLRGAHRREGAGRRCAADRHRRPAAEQGRADGRAGKDRARDEEGRADRAACGAARARRHRGPERAVAGRDLREDRRRHRPGDDQARRHGARRHPGRDRGKFGLPVHFIGVGEGVDDLAPFTARDFARARRRAGGLESIEPEHQRWLGSREKSNSIRSSSSRSISGRWCCSSSPMRKLGIFAATGVFMVAMLLALSVSYVLTRHLPVMPMSPRSSSWCSAG